MSEKDTHTPATPEQAADLAALTAAATDTAAAPATQGAAGAPAQEANLAADISGLIAMLVATLAPAFPSLKKIYTPDVTGAAGGAIAAVCKKHGWMQGGMFGEWGEEIACLAIVGPLAVTTVAGIKGDIAARAKQKPEQIAAKEETKQVQGDALSAGVTFGEVGQ
jgi:hypothetical protein